jgi:phenylalanyl-tRNA synthetase alpha subunit
MTKVNIKNDLYKKIYDFCKLNNIEFEKYINESLSNSLLNDEYPELLIKKEIKEKEVKTENKDKIKKNAIKNKKKEMDSEISKKTEEVIPKEENSNLVIEKVSNKIKIVKK